ncbi:MAG: hypothetical protein HY858_06615 [Candidatus Solibacter usitatus]|nr:hypothetical protein [Candidatus Solibacter usitatus]
MAEEVAVNNALARRFRQRIVRRYMVRFHMGLILAATTASGVLASKLLLEAGLLSVRFRYPLAVLGACLVFLGLTRLWVAYVLMSSRPSGRAWWNWGPDGLDIPHAGGGGGQSGTFSFSGGDSGGGGASTSWDDPGASSSIGASSSGKGWFPSLDLDVDLPDCIAILVLLGALVVAILGAGVYLISAAPEILPDAALSALMASSLSRAARKAEAHGWVSSVLRATFGPMLLVLALAAGLGFAVHYSCPAAAKLADVLACPDTVKGGN